MESGEDGQSVHSQCPYTGWGVRVGGTVGENMIYGHM